MSILSPKVLTYRTRAAFSLPGLNRVWVSGLRNFAGTLAQRTSQGSEGLEINLASVPGPVPIPPAVSRCFEHLQIATLRVDGLMNQGSILDGLRIGLGLAPHQCVEWGNVKVDRGPSRLSIMNHSPEMLLFLFHQATGKLAGAQASLQEVTQELAVLRTREAEAQIAAEERQRVLIKQIIHDLNNLLAPIVGYVDLIPQESLSEKGCQNLEIIKNSATHLTRFLQLIQHALKNNLFRTDNTPDARKSNYDILKHLIDMARSGQRFLPMEIFLKKDERRVAIGKFGRLLIADNDPDLLELHQEIFTSCLHCEQVTTANTPQQAIELALHGRARFDLIILDFDFKAEKNGFDICRAVTPKFAQEAELAVPIVLLSGEHLSKAEPAASIGFAASIAKPLQKESVAQFFRTLLWRWNNLE